MRSMRLATKLVGLIFALSILLGAFFTPSAGAAGVEVFRTDSQGRKTGTVTSVGNTGSNAYCARAGFGDVGFGVAVCYL